MKEIPLTKGKFAVVDDEDFSRLSRWKWHYGKRGYAARTVEIGYFQGKRKQTQILMHREVIEVPNNMFVDHINGDKLDNQKTNLRIVNTQQNNWNSKTPAHNTSGFKGVSEDKRNLSKKWQAYITVDNKKIHLGYFSTKEDAAKAYNEAAKEIFGEYARLNNLIYFEYEYLPTMELVREQIRKCESFHSQQVAYSTFHDALTQVCFGCKTVRSNIKIYERT